MIVAFSYSYRQLVLYSHFCASTTTIWLFGIPYIDHHLPQWWYIGLFSTRASITQTTRNVTLPFISISTMIWPWEFFSPHLASQQRWTIRLTSILVSHLASYTISQQGITPSKLSWLKTLWWDILFSMFVGEIRFHVLISTLQAYYNTYRGKCQPPIRYFFYKFYKIILYVHTSSPS